jgi:hypothetical protein
VFVRRAFPHHRYRYSFVVVVIVLVCADVDVIARLKIADVRFTARRSEVFRRTRDRDRGDLLVVVLDDDRLFPDVPQCPDERARVGLAPLLLRTALLRIPLARVSPTGISHAGYADHDLTKPGNAAQKDEYQQ